MTVYFVPTIGEPDAIISLASKAGIAFEEVATTRELILKIDEHSHLIVAVPPSVFLVINKHASQLLSEMPTVVMSVPGLVYQADWVTLASPYHVSDYSELESKLSKSGLVAHTPEDLEKRGAGAIGVNEIPDVVDPPMSLRGFQKAAHEQRNALADPDVSRELLAEARAAEISPLTNSEDLPGE